MPATAKALTATEDRPPTEDELMHADGRLVSEADYWAYYYDFSDVHYEWNNGRLEEKPVSDNLTYWIYDWLRDLLNAFLETHPIAKCTALEHGFRLALPDRIVIRKPDLASGADQQLVDADGDPPLSLALRREDASIATLLLAAGGSPLVPLGADRRPAPFEAIATGNPALLRLLLDFGLDADLTDSDGVPLLAHAVERQDPDLVRALLEHGADADTRLASGAQALTHLAGTGEVGLAELLLEHGADVNAADADGEAPLVRAVAGRHSDLARLLLQRGAVLPAAPRGTPSLLHRAAEQGDLATVRVLLEHGGDIEAPLPNGLRLTEYAVDSDQMALLDLLLAHGAQAEDLVVRALRQGKAGILADLLARGASVEARIDDQPLIEWAVRNASPGLVGVLLDHGADPDLVGREGQSLLALAVALDRPEVVAALADHGADIDARVASPASEAFTALFPTRYARFYLTKDRGLTPLMLAVLRGRQDTVRVLLDRDARLDTPTGEHGTWPIGLAAWQEDIEMMQLLLGRDPDPAQQRRRILVSLADQTASLYLDGKAILKTRVSTGRPGYETPPGKYVITNKHRQWTSTLYDAEMPYFLRLNAGSIGLHQGAVPNRPASHGCIRVPSGTAQKLFASARVGDLVTIVKGSLATAEAEYFAPNEKTMSN
jgi:ankyrin repeat protein